LGCAEVRRVTYLGAVWCERSLVRGRKRDGFAEPNETEGNCEAALLLLKLCVFKLWWKILRPSVGKGMKKEAAADQSRKEQCALTLNSKHLEIVLHVEHIYHINFILNNANKIICTEAKIIY